MAMRNSFYPVFETGPRDSSVVIASKIEFRSISCAHISSVVINQYACPRCDSLQQCIVLNGASIIILLLYSVITQRQDSINKMLVLIFMPAKKLMHHTSLPSGK